jgi:hypothetical protein
MKDFPADSVTAGISNQVSLEQFPYSHPPTISGNKAMAIRKNENE